jgi:anti-sigma B factor antagonist
MDIAIDQMDGVTVVTMAGEMDSQGAPQAQEMLLPLAGPGALVLLDMNDLTYLSSAGLRTLLLVYRQITGGGGRVVLVGVRPELYDVMSATGFLEHFMLADTVDDGYAALVG